MGFIETLKNHLKIPDHKKKLNFATKNNPEEHSGLERMK